MACIEGGGVWNWVSSTIQHPCIAACIWSFEGKMSEREVNFDACFLQPHAKSEAVDLTDTSLVVDISDALSEKDKVKFTVQTKVSSTSKIYYFYLHRYMIKM